MAPQNRDKPEVDDLPGGALMRIAISKQAAGRTKKDF